MSLSHGTLMIDLRVFCFLFLVGPLWLFEGRKRFSLQLYSQNLVSRLSNYLWKERKMGERREERRERKDGKKGGNIFSSFYLFFVVHTRDVFYFLR